MLEELIKEMFTECHYCNGTGIELDEEGQFEIGSETPCKQCKSTGKILSYKGERFRYLIMKGELP